MLKTRPYFMENPEWYYHDRKKMKYFLTDKAPKEAIESYNEFYNDEEEFSLFYRLEIQDKIHDLKQEGKSKKEIIEEIKKIYRI